MGEWANGPGDCACVRPIANFWVLVASHTISTVPATAGTRIPLDPHHSRIRSGRTKKPWGMVYPSRGGGGGGCNRQCYLSGLSCVMASAMDLRRRVRTNMPSSTYRRGVESRYAHTGGHRRPSQPPFGLVQPLYGIGNRLVQSVDHFATPTNGKPTTRHNRQENPQDRQTPAPPPPRK